MLFYVLMFSLLNAVEINSGMLYHDSLVSPENLSKFWQTYYEDNKVLLKRDTSLNTEGGVVNTEVVPIKAKSEKPTLISEHVPNNENPKQKIPTVVEDENDIEVPPSQPAPTTSTSLNQIDFGDEGVWKRGLIVFGGFAFLALAYYFVVYRRKSNKNDSIGSGNLDGPQFRYGVLQSDDRRDNLELSRMPLTMESDDEDDEDLEIFDLEQKKKSLSYVNLQMSDEAVFHGLDDKNPKERDDLLLDIDDKSETLISLTGSNSKSVL